MIPQSPRIWRRNLAFLPSKCIEYCFLSIHCNALFMSLFLIQSSSFVSVHHVHYCHVAVELLFHWPATIQSNFTTSVSFYWWNQAFYWKSLRKKDLDCVFFDWPEVFSLCLKEKQQRSSQKVKMVNPTCKMLIPKKTLIFSISTGWTSTMYPENCHPKDTGPIQKHPLNLPWCGETEYQNEKLLSIFFLPPKKMAGMFFLCADAGWL